MLLEGFPFSQFNSNECQNELPGRPSAMLTFGKRNTQIKAQHPLNMK